MSENLDNKTSLTNRDIYKFVRGFEDKYGGGTLPTLEEYLRSLFRGIDKRMIMKRVSQFLSVLLLIAVSACQSSTGDLKSAYTARNVAFNSGTQVYTFSYPATWSVEEQDEMTVLVSQRALLDDLPREFGAGQVLVLVRIAHTHATPASIISDYVAQHHDQFTFSDPILYDINGRSAVRVVGIRVAPEEQSLTVAVDLAEDVRGVVGARLAKGELRVWQQTVLDIANSLHLAP